MGGACSAYGDRRGLYRVLVEKSEGKNKLEKPRPRWEDNIKIYLQEVGYGAMDWNDMAQSRDGLRVFVNAAMNIWVP